MIRTYKDALAFIQCSWLGLLTGYQPTTDRLINHRAEQPKKQNYSYDAKKDSSNLWQTYETQSQKNTGDPEVIRNVVLDVNGGNKMYYEEEKWIYISWFEEVLKRAREDTNLLKAKRTQGGKIFGCTYVT